MIRRLWQWLRETFCQHREFAVVQRVPPDMGASPSSNMISSSGSVTDNMIRSDFLWSLAAFKGFRDTEGEPVFAGLGAVEGEVWWPMECMRCSCVRFVKVEVK
jgi:hypothetical protein